MENISFMGWIILIVTGLFFFMRLYFYLLQIKLMKFIAIASKNDFLPSVSVIIAAKDEAGNLKNFLYGILEQDYPEYEVIVVNDGSYDDTEKVIESYQKKYSHLRTTYIKPDNQFKHGKKLAITIGVKAAKNDFFVFTDADCHVVSNQWLKLMSRNFKENALVLGYGGYGKEPTILNKLVRYDTVQIAILYFSKALSGSPYMGVGRNMAYTRSLYNQVNGFSSHYHIPTGDDDLFVNEAKTYAKTGIEINPDSFTVSVPPQTFKEWYEQKSRHLSGSKFYSISQRLFLGLESISRGLFHILVIISIIFFPNFLLPVTILVFLDLLVKYIISGKLFRHFEAKDLLFYLIFFDFIATFLVFVRLIMNIFTTRQKTVWT